MKLAKEVLSLMEDKPVNYTVKGILHFDDGQNKGQTKIKAINAQEAEKEFRSQMEKRWKGVKKIEILSVKKG